MYFVFCSSFVMSFGARTATSVMSTLGCAICLRRERSSGPRQFTASVSRRPSSQPESVFHATTYSRTSTVARSMFGRRQSDPEDLGHRKRELAQRKTVLSQDRQGIGHTFPRMQPWPMWSSGLPLTTGRRNPGQRSDRRGAVRQRVLAICNFAFLLHDCHFMSISYICSILFHCLTCICSLYLILPACKWLAPFADNV